MATSQTAKTLYISASNGVRYAYRKFGKAEGVPLVMQNHYRSNMDYWDPLLLNALASERPVILFDQAGVGRSGGEVATTFDGWADHIIALTKALGIEQFDLLGFSMGGGAVQMVALKAPQAVRKLIIAGSTASIPGPSSDTSGTVWPQAEADPKYVVELSTPAEGADSGHVVGYSFFYETDEGRAHAKAYWNRVLEGRNVPDEPVLTELLNDEGTGRQMQAAREWQTYNPDNSYDRLGELKMPVLVVNGDDDYLIPTSRSYTLAVKIENAQLIIYPKAGHGFLHQYAELVGKHVNLFLGGFGGARL
jgi:pimeloyl-ACP methyl ester carboxylesterase